MLKLIIVVIRFVILVFGGQKQVALENAALRQQLAVFKRDVKRPRLHRRDRMFWIGLRTIWKEWKSALVIVRLETDFMAAESIQTVLVETLATENTRTTANKFGHPHPGPDHGRRERHVGRAANSR